MKEITILLKDEEWKELCDTVRHEIGESITDEETEKMIKEDIIGFIRETYIRGLGV